MTPLIIRIPGDIRGKARAQRLGNRYFVDEKTQTAEAWIRHCALQQVGQPCLTGAITLYIRITVGIPESWSKKRKAEALAGAIRPTTKPDWDNTGKLVGDALNTIIWKDDAQIVDARVVKFYGLEPGAVLEVCGPENAVTQADLSGEYDRAMRALGVG